MAILSTAIQLDRIASVIGYALKRALGDFPVGTLPQNIGIFSEANTDNQLDLTPLTFTNSLEVGEKFGFGSPSHIIALKLRPLDGDRIGSIKTTIYPQAEDIAGVAQITTITVTGVATANATHSLKINGQSQAGGTPYTFTVLKDDTANEVAQKINDAVNNVASAPIDAPVTAALDDSVLTTKWKGATSAGLIVEVITNNEPVGLDYVVADTTAGAGAPDITQALTDIGEDWVTMIVNSYGSYDPVLDQLDTWGGNPIERTGRYNPIAWKPAIALFGSKDPDETDLLAVMEDRSTYVTNALCPTGNTEAWEFEIPASFAEAYVPKVQLNPINGLEKVFLRDLAPPVNGDIGDMKNYNVRDNLVKGGVSTSLFREGRGTNGWEVQDFVTSYHPAAIPAGQWVFNRCRFLEIHWNIKYGYLLEQELVVWGKTVVPANQPTTAENVITTSSWKGVVSTKLTTAWATRAWIVNPAFTRESIEVSIGETNPSRFETAFDYQVSTSALILSTDAEASLPTVVVSI